jgi:hypothetical protein
MGSFPITEDKKQIFFNLNSYLGFIMHCKGHKQTSLPKTQEKKKGRNKELLGSWKENHHFVAVTHAKHESDSFRKHIGIKMVGAHESHQVFDFGSFIR